jgi:hypothetical protein
VVEVGGLARTDPDAFAAEFEELVGRLRTAIPEHPSPDSPTTDSPTTDSPTTDSPTTDSPTTERQ